MSLRLLLAMTTVLTAIIITQSSAAHPVHFSFAEAEWNVDSQCLEVALRMEPEALQSALRRSDSPAARRITLESRAAATLIREYVLENFVVSTESGKHAEIRWVGHEATLKTAWVYFEVALPAGPDDVQISNRLLFEEAEEQVNVVAVRDGDRRGSVHLTAKTPTKTLILASTPEKTLP